MSERPILFSTPMVKAILEGRKTQTRRIVKPQVQEIYYMKNAPLDYHNYTREPWKPWKYDLDDGNSGSMLCPYGEHGDRLWVRETWFPTRFDVKQMLSRGDTSCIRYKADGTYDPGRDCVGRSWKPSIHMPKAAARIWLEVEEVRVERLQEISEEDAIAEGVKENVCEMASECPSALCANGCQGKGEYWNYLDEMQEGDPCYSAAESYKTLWQSINGPESWEQNPWVWVVKFKRIEL